MMGMTEHIDIEQVVVAELFINLEHYTVQPLWLYLF